MNIFSKLRKQPDPKQPEGPKQTEDPKQPDIEALKAKGDIEGLIKALKYEGEGKIPLLTIRKTAAIELGNIGDPQAVEHLISAFDAYLQPDEVGVAAIQSLEKFPKHYDLVLPKLIDLVEHNDFFHVEACKAAYNLILRMGQIAIKPIAEELQEIFSKDPYDHLFRARNFVKILGEIGGADAVEALLSLPESYRTNDEWIEASSNIGGDKAEEALISIFTSDLVDITTSLNSLQFNCLGKLEKIGGKQTIRMLKAAIPHVFFDQNLKPLEEMLLKLEGAPVVYNIRCWVETISPQSIPAIVPLEATARVLAQGLEIAYGYINPTPMESFERATQVGLFHTISTENTLDPTVVTFRKTKSIVGNFSTGDIINQIFDSVISPDNKFSIEISYEKSKENRTLLKLSMVADSAPATDSPEETIALYNSLVDGLQLFSSIPVKK